MQHTFVSAGLAAAGGKARAEVGIRGDVWRKVNPARPRLFARAWPRQRPGGRAAAQGRGIRSGPQATRTGPPGGRAPRPPGRGGGANGQRARPFPSAEKAGLLAAKGRFIVVGSGSSPAARGMRTRGGGRCKEAGLALAICRRGSGRFSFS